MADTFDLSQSLSDLAGGVGTLGGAAQDLFAVGADKARARGYVAEGAAYGTAAGFSDQNAAIERQSTAIQIAQTQRGLGQIVGGQKSDIASAGFENSGSALDIARSTAQQGHLQLELLKDQGLIQENAYSSQAASYRGEQESANASADAAEAAAKGNQVSGIVKTVSGVAKVVGTIASIAKFFL